ncbi:MAG: hypothetical protein LC713_00635, partial [Actinobacteria bacterium]|nr:hypothetical protein [Actinomycetota bacterium]
APLVRLYSEYMHTDYGDLDSDYVFVNLWAEPLGRPLRYQAVTGLVRRLRARSASSSTSTCCATPGRRSFRQGVAIEVVSKLLTHFSGDAILCGGVADRAS